MGMRDVSLTPRTEAVRDVKRIEPPKHFSLEEILQHYKESMEAINEQFTIADALKDDGKEVGCKIIWRSQVVLAEGLMDFYIHELSKYCLFRCFLDNGLNPKNIKSHLWFRWKKLRKL